MLPLRLAARSLSSAAAAAATAPRRLLSSRIAFIGCGNMGAHMAGNLAKAGNAEVVCFDYSADALKAVEALVSAANRVCERGRAERRPLATVLHIASTAA